MEEPLEILVVEHEPENRRAAQKACPDGVILIFARNYEEGMIEADRPYYGAIIEHLIPKSGSINGWGYLTMCKTMNNLIPSLLFTEKPEWGKARVYDDPCHYMASHDRYVLETPHKTEEAAWKQVFGYLMKNRQTLRGMLWPGDDKTEEDNGTET